MNHYLQEKDNFNMPKESDDAAYLKCTEGEKVRKLVIILLLAYNMHNEWVSNSIQPNIW